MKTSSRESVIDSKEYINKTSLCATTGESGADCISLDIVNCLGKQMKINVSVRSVDCKDKARYDPKEFQVVCHAFVFIFY
jgi:hypothetical protein